MGKLRSTRVENLLAQTLNEFIALPQARVLDIGAGQVVEKNHRAGFHDLAERYARLMATGHYIGLEIGAESKPAVVGDAHRLPFADGSMDGVLMVSVLEHLYDPIRAADQVYRVLKPGGIFFSYAPFYHPYHASPHDYFRMTTDGYRYLLRDFREVKLVSGGNYIAVLNDIVSYPLTRSGRIGRALSKLVELPLGLLFRAFDDRTGTRVAVGYGAWARK
ncbi:MAG: class I SAM-dependent methyltransferase [Anaerolineae bacterium]